MRKSYIGVGLVILAVLVGFVVWRYSQPTQIPDSTRLSASVRFGWIPSASFSGEIVGIRKFAQGRNLDLKAEPGGPGMNSIQLVQAGQNTFGTLAADEVLAANDKGADFVIVGVINYYSPGGFVSLVEKSIKSPKDFENHRVGLLPFGSTTLLYESLLKKNGVDKKKVQEITVSPDMKPFLSGSYDVHPVFVYDETVTLDQLGIKYNLIEPKEFGVKFKGPVYFCKRETLEKNPELVKAFVETMAEGWNYAISNPDEAITLLKEFAPEVDTVRERLVLEKAIPYYSGYNKQPINSDVESWNEMVAELKELNVIRNDVDLSRVLFLTYINAYYKSE
ncbi:ABC transporter substrate-binding protein [Leptolyngbya sp. 7M]|uniref:ABC transporter substrate-binding protein n=1 Tax=Leptolyngbya sp. 7M TaxID=2812896 RepID=UPI001B8CCA3B|nr:ABC transporter substrate-binding protein [Leptolyngbya sp. 7M]QYO65282.1 ABC transporter substrate-binding protein [Leptolyngbya sp. 7M]